MGKNNKKNSRVTSPSDLLVSKYSPSKMDKKYGKALKEIEEMRLNGMEYDKYYNSGFNKRGYNRKESQFYYDMEGVKSYHKNTYKTKQKGLIDRFLQLIESVAPIIKYIGKLIAAAILAFLSIDVVKKNITPNALGRLTKIFNIATSV